MSRAIYGVGPTPALVTERYPFVSDFVRAVGNAASGHGIMAGGTFGAGTGRYIVGGYADARVIRRGVGRAQAQASALAFSEENREALSRFLSLGFWTDPKTGRICLDVTVRHDSWDEAIAIASRRGESAIWDDLAGKAIKVKRAP